MTTLEMIDALLQREGGFSNQVGDRGHATNFGITALRWGQTQNLGRPATIAEMQAITRDQAVAFYQGEFQRSPFTAVKDETLRVALFDFGENSGPARAIRWLQRAIGLPVTGVMDAATRAAVSAHPPQLVVNALTAARVAMIMAAIDAGTIPKEDERGLLRRAVSLAELSS